MLTTHPEISEGRSQCREIIQHLPGIENINKDERWIQVRPFLGRYYVSNMGRIASNANGRWFKKDYYGIVTPLNHTNGYKKVVLCLTPKAAKQIYVHRLVLSEFSDEIPAGMDVSHQNHIRNDNRLENLQWATRKENMQLSVRDGRSPFGEKNPMSILDEAKVKEIYKFNDSLPLKSTYHDFETSKTKNEFCKKLSITRATFNLIIRGKLWPHLFKSKKQQSAPAKCVHEFTAGYCQLCGFDPR